MKASIILQLTIICTFRRALCSILTAMTKVTRMYPLEIDVFLLLTVTQTRADNCAGVTFFDSLEKRLKIPSLCTFNVFRVDRSTRDRLREALQYSNPI